MRQRGGGGVASVDIDEHVDGIGGEHFERGRPRQFRQGVGVTAHEEGSRDALCPPEPYDGRGGGHDVGLVEGRGQRGATVTRGAEGSLF